MSRRVSELPRRLVKYDTEHSQSSIEKMSDVGMVRRATTVADKLPLDLEMLGIKQEDYKKNPFLKAKVQAYLNHLTTSSTSSESIKDRLHSISPEDQLPLFQDERVTFKGINQEVLQSNSHNAQELSKKLQNGKSVPLKKN